MRTRWSPNDVIDAPPLVLDRVLEHIVAEAERQARDKLRGKLQRRGR